MSIWVIFSFGSPYTIDVEQLLPNCDHLQQVEEYVRGST